MDQITELVMRLAGPPHYQSLPSDLYGIGAPRDPALAEVDRGVADAFRARADARMSRGEYHLAVADYGRAINATPLEYEYEKNPEASVSRRVALGRLAWYFGCGGNPENLPAGVSEDTRAAVRAARLPIAHLVVAEGGGILAAYPLSDEGRQAAVEHADVLASDPAARSRIDHLYLAETDDFDTVVYRHEGGEAIEVYRAEPREEAEASGEE